MNAFGRRAMTWTAAAILVAAGQVWADREVMSLDQGWRFAQGEQTNAPAVDFDDSAWQLVQIPHDWAIAGPFNPQENGYAGKLPWRGVGWYRRTFRLDAADAGKRVYLDFDGVMAFPKVYINGRLAGEWDYGYMSFRVDATPFVKWGGENVLAVQADTRNHGTRWYPGAGIYRDVRMTLCEPVHIAHWGTFVTTQNVRHDMAEVRIRTRVKNHTDRPARVSIRTLILDPDGRRVAGAQTPAREIETGGAYEFDQTQPLRDVQRWDIESPNLYTAQSTVLLDGKPVDADENTFGVRTFRFTADDGFHLNGRRVQLYGVNLHHDQGPLGAAFYPAAMERQLRIMKEMGCNALRTSHNPPAPQVLDLCDRMGIIVWDECFDKWNSTSDRPRGVDLVEHNKKQLRNFVRRDRNHPSVVLWSIGNEIADIEKNDSGKAHEQVAQLREFVLRQDPTRPVGMGCYIPSAVGTRVLESLDLTGWNYDRRYAPYRQLFPNKPIVYSESASALSNRGFYQLPLPQNKTDYAADEHQVDSYDHNAAPWSDIADREFALMERDDFVAGEFVWTGFDYLGEPTPFAQEAKSSYFGIVDLCGMPKDRYWLYRSYWRPEALTVHILPHWNWPDRTGRNVPVYVYTNGDTAELFLNGKSLGRRSKSEPVEPAANLAAGKSVAVSSEETSKGNLASLATDGQEQTRWCAVDGSVPQWLQVDLGSVQPIPVVQIALEKEPAAYGYAIETSDDGQTWKQAARKPIGESGSSHSLNAQGRYLRIRFTDLAPQTWASIREIGVYEEPVESSYYAVMDRYRLRWLDVPYEPGELRAVAYRNGEKIGEATVKTAGEPAALRLTCENEQVAATGKDLAYILVEAIDRDGNLCPLADNDVRFTIEGPAVIAAVGNGDPLSIEPFVADRRSLFFGKAMLILRCEPGRTGTIHIRATAEGLAGAAASVTAVKP